MRQPIIFLLLVLNAPFILAQNSDSSFLISRNQQIDTYVVEHNTTALDSLYAEDFVFSHGSGRIEGKKGWLTSVEKGSFISRQHDSVTVEWHPQLAILRGKLTVQKKERKKQTAIIYTI